MNDDDEGLALRPRLSDASIGERVFGLHSQHCNQRCPNQENYRCPWNKQTKKLKFCRLLLFRMLHYFIYSTIARDPQAMLATTANKSDACFVQWRSLYFWHHSHTVGGLSTRVHNFSWISSNFGLHREVNFGPESAWFRFQIQKYENQTLVKKRNSE